MDDPQDPTDPFSDVDPETLDDALNNPDPPASHEPNFAELHAYKKALESELREAEISSEDSPDEIKVKARKIAIQHLPMALQKIADLVTSAEKENTQLAAAKAIYSIATEGLSIDEKDPLKQLFHELTKTDAEA
jgi:hypothetical protein